MTGTCPPRRSRTATFLPCPTEFAPGSLCPSARKPRHPVLSVSSRARVVPPALLALLRRRTTHVSPANTSYFIGAAFHEHRICPTIGTHSRCHMKFCTISKGQFDVNAWALGSRRVRRDAPSHRRHHDVPHIVASRLPPELPQVEDRVQGRRSARAVG
ncbi:hypothetical protein L227DRAFT_223733 [Lentinus tigrinus ALCF2SS1-6]|uniref:Uncharacterized protein n=1 Tax=Lentinus tigrinus ALCF2SS1-6 TaxID=1328759 RepID=A0A5C2S2R7_9APHY|nr:hypothetical protein L227DRAFT_223733 [Lentinus tigrinus ALCF2SS1-6]